jgi:hypothetical protein
MKLQFSSVADKGSFDKERLILKALVDTDVGEFVLFQTGRDPEGVTTTVHHVYWFPYKKVSAGDLIIIYTKSGTDRQKSIEGNQVAHFYYWGLSSPIWKTRERAAVILYAPEWDSKMAEAL